MSEPAQRFTFKVPDEFDAFDREAIAEEVIEYIRQRTEEGRDINGAPFAPYSKSYINSLEFEIAGKSPYEVNLRLTGDMMESIKLITHSTGSVTIGFEPGEENDKAAWAAASDNGPSRRFLGVMEDELEDIIDRYRKENPLAPEPKAERRERERLVDKVLRAANLRIWGSR